MSFACSAQYTLVFFNLHNMLKVHGRDEAAGERVEIEDLHVFEDGLDWELYCGEDCTSKKR